MWPRYNSSALYLIAGEYDVLFTYESFRDSSRAIDDICLSFGRRGADEDCAGMLIDDSRRETKIVRTTLEQRISSAFRKPKTSAWLQLTASMLKPFMRQF